MEEYTKLYEISKRKQEKIMLEFLSETLGLMIEEKSKKISNILVETDFFENDIYAEIKEIYDNLAISIDYMESVKMNKDDKELIRVYKLINKMNELGTENIQIFKEIIKDYLKLYERNLKEYVEYILNLKETIDYDKKKDELVINKKLLINNEESRKIKQKILEPEKNEKIYL